MTKVGVAVLSLVAILLVLAGILQSCNHPKDTVVFYSKGTDMSGDFRVFEASSTELLVTRDMKDFFMINSKYKWVKMTTKPYGVEDNKVIYDLHDIDGKEVGFSPDGTEDVSVSNGMWSFWIRERNEKLSHLSVKVK